MITLGAFLWMATFHWIDDQEEVAIDTYKVTYGYVKKRLLWIHCLVPGKVSEAAFGVS